MQHLEHSREFVNEGMMIRTMDGRINSWDRGAAELYGWKEEEAIGKISHDLLHTEFPKPLEQIESELIRNGRWEGKLVHSTRDGARVVVKSQWALDLEGLSRAVVEINARESNSDVSIKPENVLTKISNFVLIAAGLFCIFTALHYFYYYGWLGERQFISRLSNMLYYYVPVGLAALFFASLQLRPSYKINVALSCVSVAGSVFAIELVLEFAQARLFDPTKPVMSFVTDADNKERAAKLTRKFGVKIDTRTPGEVIANLREEGIDAIPIITPSNNLFIEQPDGSIRSALEINGREVMPLAGVSHKVTLLCNESGQWIDYRSDRHGFNNSDDQVWQSNPLQIAALGDSFTHGYCVPNDQNFVALIQHEYPATLNLGIAGDGPLLMLAKVKEYLRPLKPKIVLWFYYEGNDLTDLQIERKSSLLRNYLTDGFSQGEIHRQSDIDQAILADLPRQWSIEKARLAAKATGKRVQLVDKFAEFAKLPMVRQRLGLTGGVSREDAGMLADLAGRNTEVFREILFQAKNQVDAWGGQLYFVYLPEWARYSRFISWGEEKRTEVLTLVGNLGIPIIDIDPVFQAHGDPLSLFPFRGLGHYTEAGHRLVAEAVLRGVAKSQVAPSSDSQ